MSVLDKDFAITLADVYRIDVDFVSNVDSMQTYIRGFKVRVQQVGPDEQITLSNQADIRRNVEKRIGALEEWGEEYVNVKRILQGVVVPQFMREGMWRCRRDTDLRGNFLGVLIELWSMEPRPVRVVHVHIERKNEHTKR